MMYRLEFDDFKLLFSQRHKKKLQKPFYMELNTELSINSVYETLYKKINLFFEELDEKVFWRDDILETFTSMNRNQLKGDTAVQLFYWFFNNYPEKSNIVEIEVFGMSILDYIVEQKKKRVEEKEKYSETLEKQNTKIENLPNSENTISNISTGQAGVIPLHTSKTLEQPDYEAEAQKNIWLVYEAAFLFHEFAPPSVEEHFALMTPEILKTKQALHSALEFRVLKTGGEVKTAEGVVFRRYIDRVELKKYAESINIKPKFLYRS